MLSDSVLTRDEAPAYYLLSQRFSVGSEERERHCLLGALRLEELGEAVLPHENTAAGPKEDRLALMRAAHANFSPILMLYRDATGAIASTLAEAAAAPPAAEFAADGERYALWLVQDDILSGRGVRRTRAREAVRRRRTPQVRDLARLSWRGTGRR